jgi:hypothetical protein
LQNRSRPYSVYLTSMKHLLLLSLLFLSICDTGCKEAVLNDENNHKMEDTLFKAFPTVRRLSIEVLDDEDVSVLLGDKELFNASDEKRKKVTEEIGRITIHIYDKDNWLKKGTVTFVADESNLDVKNAEKKVYDMQIEQLKEHVGK